MGRLCHSVIFFLLLVQNIHARTVYTFENANQLSDFSAPATSTLALSTTRYKDGTRSMKWTWTSGDEITHSISPAINGSEGRRGGIKVWLYNPHKRPAEHLTVSFAGATTTISNFTINLDFTGWRAVWVSYAESLFAQQGDITSMRITAPTTTEQTHPLYIDLFRLVDNLSRQSRDKIVPTLVPQYDPNNFWQQTYRWSQANPTEITEMTPSDDKLADLTLIEKRLDNWFVRQSQSSNQFTGNVKKRWDSLQEDVDDSHTKFASLNIAKSATGVITGTPLFCERSEYDDEKFGYVVEKVLLPMALDYHIRSRANEVDGVAAAELSNLNGVTSAKTEAIKRIAGSDSTMQQAFTTALGSATPYTEMKVKEAITAVNNKRKERLLLLLDYIEDQGFTEGHALGSLDHEMNNAGAGFMNAAYVLRKVLQDANKKADYVATMKWYNDFGEIYQNPFEYAGTTADRMRTIAFWRLFAVLMMPTSTTSEKQAKIRDMEALGRWYANVISPNEGFAGVLKPDYVGFHHNSYYASAYTPHALHNAALIQYLLSGTAFAFGAETKRHVKKGLEVMRVVSVKYSSPNSVSGRFPGFTRVILAKTFPAYAYFGVTAPNANMDGSLGEIASVDSEDIKMFLRLYDTGDSAVNDYLADGTIFTSIYYLNSIGSINIMEEINSKATNMSIAAEASPKGFWALNYAAFVVQRRNDWAVSVKGFNNYVWDFEASGNQNVYGIYQSHGALLVANSEAALETHDIDNGWDWTRHPGTTTIKLALSQLVSENRRYYQPKELAGGVRLVGGGAFPTGAFAMDFSQPPYKWAANAFQNDINFTFKKTVFFAEFVIICLGSGITSSGTQSSITQTTLFQNKLLDDSNPSSIYVNDTSHSLNTDLTKLPASFNGNGNPAATLFDVNGNGYYIPNATEQGLNVSISLQTSRDSRGRRDTSARYATAWLNHGVDPSDKGYEYTIVVNKPRSTVRALSTQQQGDSPAYEVLRRDNFAHVVKIPNCPRVNETQYGYVIFDKSVRTDGPIRRVDKPNVIVMVEEVDDDNLYISVSFPNLNFNISRESDDPLEMGPQVSARERFYSISMGRDIRVWVKNAVNIITGVVRVNGEIVGDSDKTNHVEIRPKGGDVTRTIGNIITFKALSKGFSKEVKVTRGSIQS